MVDIAFLAAMAAALCPPLVCWKWGASALKWVLLLQLMLFGANLVLSWRLDDPPNTVVEGQTVAFGLILSIAVLIFGMALLALSIAAMRMLSPHVRDKEGTEK